MTTLTPERIEEIRKTLKSPWPAVDLQHQLGHYRHECHVLRKYCTDLLSAYDALSRRGKPDILRFRAAMEKLRAGETTDAIMDEIEESVEGEAVTLSRDGMREAFVKARMIEETGWVIEFDESEPSHPAYWIGPSENPAHWPFGLWAHNHLMAVRFARKEDADAVVRHTQEWAHNDPRAVFRVCDHMWCDYSDAALSPDAPHQKEDQYQCECVKCGKRYIGAKRSSICPECKSDAPDGCCAKCGGGHGSNESCSGPPRPSQPPKYIPRG